MNKSLIKRQEEKKCATNLCLRSLIICLLAIAASVSLLQLPQIFDWTMPIDWRQIINDRGIPGAIFTGLFCWFYSKTLFSSESKAFKLKHGFPQIKYSSLIFSALFSAALLIGTTFHAFGNWDFIAANNSKLQIFWNVMLLLGSTPLFYTLVELAFYYAGKGAAETPKKNLFRNSKTVDFVLEKRPFLGPFLFLLLAWLPIWIVMLPGNVQFDAHTQFAESFGYTKYADGNPLLATLTYGFIARIGQIFYTKNFNVSLFLVILFQQIISSTACAYALMVTKNWGISKNMRLISIGFWAFHPWFPFSISQASSKNLTSSALLLLFLVLFCDMIRCVKFKEWGNSSFLRRLTIIIVVSILTSLFNRSNVYIIVLSIIPLAFLKQKINCRLVFVLAGIAIFLSTNLINAGLRRVLNVDTASSSITPFLSIPVQQTAMFLRMYPDDVTPQERADIDAFLEFEKLPEVYRGDISDFTLKTIRHFNTFSASNDNDRKVLRNYLYSWLKMGLRHPEAYAAATIANTSYYWAPEKGVRVFQWGFDYFGFGGGSSGYMQKFYQAYPTVHLFSPETRSAVQTFFWAFHRLPGLGVFSRLSTYTWLILFCGLFLIREKRTSFLYALLPPLLIVLVCISSPVNGHQRYFLPVVMMTPMLLNWVAYSGIFQDKSK